MPLFSRKPKLTTEEACKEFYDQNIFKANLPESGLDVWQLFLDTNMKKVIEADTSLESVDKNLFRREMTAIRLEIFALAWQLHRFKPQHAYPQSIFTRRYLEESGYLEIWDVMGEYNLSVSRSATLNAKGEKLLGSLGRVAITMNILNRANFYKDWIQNNSEVNLQTEEGSNKAKCITRVINRNGADVKREDCLLVKLLSFKLAERLGLNSSLKPEALYWLQTAIFGFNQGATEYIKSIALHD
jgi:hypothetical protein